MDAKAVFRYLNTKAAITPEDYDHLNKHFQIDNPEWRKKLVEYYESIPLDRYLLENGQAILKLHVMGLLPLEQNPRFWLNLLNLFCPSAEELYDLFCTYPFALEAIPHLFAFEGQSDISLANADTFSRLETPWQNAILLLIKNGYFSRNYILDKTLYALEQGWIQFRSGWYSRFHQALAPSTEEMLPFLPRYLHLSQSSIAPTVSLALQVLKHIHKTHPIGDATVLDSLSVVYTSRTKSQILAVLSLFQSMVQHNNALAPLASRHAIAGLVHESAEVQDKILDALQQWGVAPEDLPLLSEYLPYIVVTLKPKVAALLPQNQELLPVTPVSTVQTEPITIQIYDPLTESYRLPFITDLNTLIERIAYILEHVEEIDTIYSVLQSIPHFLPLQDAFLEAASPVLKRAQTLLKNATKKRLNGMGYKELLAQYVYVLLTKETYTSEHIRLQSVQSHISTHTPKRYQGATAEFFSIEISACIEALQSYQPEKGYLTPLCLPTHRKGYIDPVILVQRIEQHQQHKREPQEWDVIRAILRLPSERLAPCLEPTITYSHATQYDPPASPYLPTTARQTQLAKQQLNKQPHSSVHAVLLYTFGEPLPKDTDAILQQRYLYVAAARIRHLYADDLELYAILKDDRPDTTLAARYKWGVKKDENGYSCFYLEPNQESVHIPMLEVSTSLQQDVIRDTVAYEARIYPSNAEGLSKLGIKWLDTEFMDAYWHVQGYIAMLLEETVQFGSISYLLLGLALMCKEPGQAATAKDVFIQGVEQRRIHPVQLGAVLREIWSKMDIVANRYAKQFRLISQHSESMSHALYQTLVEAICLPPMKKFPKNFSSILEVVLEIRTQYGLTLPIPTRSALETMPKTGKMKPILTALLQTS